MEQRVKSRGARHGAARGISRGQRSLTKRMLPIHDGVAHAVHIHALLHHGRPKWTFSGCSTTLGSTPAPTSAPHPDAAIFVPHP